jgi:hypothetical protein
MHPGPGQANTLLAKTKSVIVLEDLNVSRTRRLRFWAGVLKNLKLARAISDVGMGEFRRQLAQDTVVWRSGHHGRSILSIVQDGFGLPREAYQRKIVTE